MKLKNLAELNEAFLVEGWEEELNQVYSEWKKWTNITASQLKAWSESPVSRMASLNPSAVIKRNLHLLETPKNQWGAKEVADAKRTIAFNKRMSSGNQGEPVRKGIPFSKRDISLLNWAYRPSTVSPSTFSSWSGKQAKEKINKAKYEN
jgi:hypothetical protein